MLCPLLFLGNLLFSVCCIHTSSWSVTTLKPSFDCDLIFDERPKFYNRFSFTKDFTVIWLNSNERDGGGEGRAGGEVEVKEEEEDEGGGGEVNGAKKAWNYAKWKLNDVINIRFRYQSTNVWIRTTIDGFEMIDTHKYDCIMGFELSSTVDIIYSKCDTFDDTRKKNYF